MVVGWGARGAGRRAREAAAAGAAPQCASARRPARRSRETRPWRSPSATTVPQHGALRVRARRLQDLLQRLPWVYSSDSAETIPNKSKHLCTSYDFPFKLPNHIAFVLRLILNILFKWLR